MVDIMDLSEYIIYYSNIKDYGISCLKLQKILYLLQAEWLITRDKRLFADKIIAWDFGVVVPEVYRKYIQWGGLDIPTSKDKSNINKFKLMISKKDLRLINDLLDYFKDYSAVLLTDITCGQAPWINAHVYHQDNEVTCDSIRNYFLSDKDKKPKRKSLKNIHDIEEIKR